MSLFHDRVRSSSGGRERRSLWCPTRSQTSSDTSFTQPNSSFSFDQKAVQVPKNITEGLRCIQVQKTAGLGAVTPLELKVKVAPQSVFYALHTRDGTCASGCGVSQTGVAEIVFGVEIVEWDLCSACLSRTGFLEYFNSLPSATPREAEEIKILLGISNETFERQHRVAPPIN